MPDSKLFHNERPSPIEDYFSHATQKQINFIEILKNDLGMTFASRNAAIRSLVNGYDNDIWALSRTQASHVIEKFKELKAAKQEAVSKQPPQRPWDD